MNRFVNAWKIMPFAVAGVISILVIAGWPGTVLAHGEAIQIDPADARPGDTITVTGTDFETGETIAITLEGTAGVTALGSALVDQDGGFNLTSTIPEDTRAGSYLIVARLGDESVALDFTVSLGSNQPAEVKAEAVVFQRSFAETVTIGIIIVALIGAGTFLVWAGTEKRTHPSPPSVSK